MTLGVLAGCSSSPFEYCQDLEQLVSQPSSASDPLQVAYHVTSYASSIAGLSNGTVLVPTCGDVAAVDIGGHEAIRIATGKPTSITAGPNDAIYAVTNTGGGRTVTALSSDGEARWKAATEALRVIGSADGAYAMECPLPPIGGSQLPCVLRSYDRETGAARTLLADSMGEQLIGAGPGGGVIGVRGNSTSATVRHLDGAGMPRWSLAVAATSLEVRDAAPTPDGGIVILGHASSTVDLGVLSIEIPTDSRRSFVAGLDAHGVPQWGYTLDGSAASISVAPDGDAILATQGDGRGIITRARATGVVATISLPGGPLVAPLDAVPAPDGTVWVEISLAGDETAAPTSLRVGSHTFSDDGFYLLQLRF